MPTVVSMLSLKSGVGKTTLTLQIAAGLALRHNKRVLLIDADPQCGLSTLATGPSHYIEHAYKSGGGTIKTLFEAHLDERNIRPFELIVPRKIRISATRFLTQIDILLSHQEMMLMDIKLGERRYQGTDETGALDFDIRKHGVLKDLVDSVSANYDYVLIDCPHNMGTLTQNALFASHYATIVAAPDFLSTNGIPTLTDYIDKFDDHWKSRLENSNSNHRYPETQLGGIIFNFIDEFGIEPKEKHQQVICNTASRNGPESVFAHYIVVGDGIQTVNRAHLPIFAFAALHGPQQGAMKQAKYFGRVVDEFVRRMG